MSLSVSLGSLHQRLSTAVDRTRAGLVESLERDAIPDFVDIAYELSQDCNGNLIPDECDLADGFSADCNSNGLPDECDTGAVGGSSGSAITFEVSLAVPLYPQQTFLDYQVIFYAGIIAQINMFVFILVA